MKDYSTINIDEYPVLKLSTIKPLIVAARDRPEAAAVTSKNFLSIGTALSIDVTYLLEKEILIFQWEYAGEKRVQKIKLLREPSNLVKGSSVLWFLCPFTGLKTRKLYTDRYKFFSRGAVRHTYSQRRLGKFERVTRGLYFRPDYAEREKGRKPYYRGQLTPYGKNLERREDRFTKAVFTTFKRLNIPPPVPVPPKIKNYISRSKI